MAMVLKNRRYIMVDGGKEEMKRVMERWRRGGR